MSQFVTTPGGYWEALIGDRTAMPVYQVWADLDDDDVCETNLTSYLFDIPSITGGGKLEGAAFEAVSNSWAIKFENTVLGWASGAYKNAKVVIKAGFNISSSDDVVTIFTGYFDEKGARRQRGQFQTQDTVSVKCIDQLARAAKTTMHGYFITGFKICDPADTANSLVHFLADQMGIDSSDVVCNTVSDVKDFVEIKEGAKPLRELQKLAESQLGYFKIRYDGKLVFASRLEDSYSEPTYEWAIGVGGSPSPSIHNLGELGTNALANRAKLEYDDYEQLPATVGSYRIVYKNTKEYDTDTGENAIEVAPGDYFPGPSQYEVLTCSYKDPESGEKLVASSVQTPTIGSDDTYDIWCSGGLLTLVSFNGSTGDTRADKDGAQMILYNGTGSTITIKKLTVRGTGYRVASKVKCEARDATITNDWELVDKKLDGTYVTSVTNGLLACEYWIDYGSGLRREFEVINDWLPQVQEGAIIRLYYEAASYTDCQVLEYRHEQTGNGMRTAQTYLKLREWYTFTSSGQGNANVVDSAEPTTITAAAHPTYEDIVDGFDSSAGTGGTTTPTTPTIAVQGIFKGYKVAWDKQTNLTNLDVYHVQVSDDDTNWYEPSFDGVDWKTGSLNGYLEWDSEFLVHPNLPFGGTTDAPTALDLYYRVRRVTKLGDTSSWSTSAHATNKLIDTGDLAANTVTANKINAGAVTTDKLYANAVTTAKIAAGAVTATEISVTSLSAISANLGTITAGTITGVTITATGTLTSVSGSYETRVTGGVIDFYYSSTRYGRISASSTGFLHLSSSGTYPGYITIGASIMYFVLNSGPSASTITYESSGSSNRTLDLQNGQLECGFVMHTSTTPGGNSCVGDGNNDSLDKIHITSTVGAQREMDYSAGW